MSGPKGFPGVFVETVRPGGLAEDYGLEVGDQIMEVNGKSFADIRHEEVGAYMHTFKPVYIIIHW